MSDAVVKGIGIFSTLQAATEAKFFLLSAAFILLVDNVFLGLHQPGIVALASSQELMSNSNLVIKVILIFVAFSFLTSLLLPILAIIFDEIYLATAGRLYISLDDYLTRKFGGHDTYSRRTREFNSVTPLELREEAHRSKDKYLLDLYKEYETEWHKNREAILQHALFSFYCLVMLAWNFYLSFGDTNAASVVLASYLGAVSYVWLAIAALLAMVLYRFFGRHQRDWIYCPSLCEKIQKNAFSVSCPPPSHNAN